MTRYQRGYDFYMKYRDSRPFVFRLILGQLRKFLASEVPVGNWMKGFYQAHLDSLEGK